MRREIEIQSDLIQSLEYVWDSINTFNFVNYELSPIMKMTTPNEFRNKKLEEFPINTTVFRSWILLFGVIPIDYSDVRLVYVKRTIGFEERSEMFSSKEWNHRRTLISTKYGCRLVDRIRFNPRNQIVGIFIFVLIKILFFNRHKRLRKKFGTIAK